MEAFGDRLAADIKTGEINMFLTTLDRVGNQARNVNKHRPVLHPILNYTRSEETFGPATNLAARWANPPAE
jgi:hypothetical protein